MCDCDKNQIFYVIILVLFVLLFWRLECVRAKVSEKLDLPDGYVGKGLVDNYQVFTSGTDLRRMGQEFTSTNQGKYLTVHNIETRDPKERVEMVCFPKNMFTPAQLESMAHDAKR